MVGARVSSELTRRLLQRTPEKDGRLVVERVRDRDRRTNPSQPVPLEIERSEEWGEQPDRMTTGADVVGKSRKRELGGADSTTDLVPGFEDAHGDPPPPELVGGGHAVRPAP